jgi:hypothetical protein
MGTLVFICPATGSEVSTGIEMDFATLQQLELSKVYCLHCRQQHQMASIQHRLEQAELLGSAHYKIAKAA